MKTPNRTRDGMLSFKVGDSVEVRSRGDILATLDKNGWLDNLPFMPEMFAYCGARFRVHKSAHKTCDTVNDSLYLLQELRLLQTSSRSGCWPAVRRAEIRVKAPHDALISLKEH